MCYNIGFQNPCYVWIKSSFSEIQTNYGSSELIILECNLFQVCGFA